VSDVTEIPAALTGHYSMPEWSLFNRNRLAKQMAKAMAEHLSGCEQCQRLVDQLPPPPRRSLGRPVPNVLYKWPTDLEKDIQAVLASLPENGGAVVRFAGDWKVEGLINYLVSLVTARLFHKKKRYAAAGILQYSDVVPAIPLLSSGEPVDVAILLNAHTYENLGEWDKPILGKFIFQLGELSAREKKGIKPDFVLQIDQTQEHKLEQYISFIKAAIHSGSPAIRAGILANGLFCDWYMPLLETDYLDRPERIPFVTVEDLEGQPFDYVCAEGGSWMVNHCLLQEPLSALEALKKDLDWLSMRLPNPATRRRIDEAWQKLRDQKLAASGLHLA
jgi:hypothetical protein